MTEVTSAPRPYTLYGRRKGRRLRENKTQLMETLLPRLSIPHEEAPLNLAALFQGAARIELEVGFGGGEHLAAQAKAAPQTGFIGCEPFVNGVASLLEHIDRENLSNIRIFADDARMLLDRLPTSSIARVYVLFSDPWPKKRHADRRFIGPANLPKLAGAMKHGAELRMASDDEVLKEWIAEQMAASPDFIAAEGTDGGAFPRRPAEWPHTRYEEKGVRLGRKPVYFCFMRK